jgi:hypothetical protein
MGCSASSCSCSRDEIVQADDLHSPETGDEHGKDCGILGNETIEVWNRDRESAKNLSEAARSLDSIEAYSSRFSAHDIQLAVASVEELAGECIVASPMDEAARAAECCQLLKAARIMKDGKIVDLPGRPNLDEHVSRVRDTFVELFSKDSEEGRNGWKKFELELCTLRRRWDPKTQALNIIMSWEAEGSILQQLAVIHDAEIAEPLWNGACWDISAQHHEGRSLVRWLQKDPFSGRKTEVIVERVLCDCLDEEDNPCWVLLERSPQVPDWDDYKGKWGPFDIPPKPKGYLRAVMAPSGRTIQPLSKNTCRSTMLLSLQVPAVVRWLVTDSLLTWAIKMTSKGTMKCWLDIIRGWDSSAYNERMKEKSLFYTQVENRENHYLNSSRLKK